MMAFRTTCCRAETRHWTTLLPGGGVSALHSCARGRRPQNSFLLWHQDRRHDETLSRRHPRGSRRATWGKNRGSPPPRSRQELRCLFVSRGMCCLLDNLNTPHLLCYLTFPQHQVAISKATIPTTTEKMSKTGFISLQVLRDNPVEEGEANAQIVDALETALNLNDDAPIAQAAMRLAKQLDSITLTLDDAADKKSEVENARYNVYTTLLAAVQQVPADHEAHRRFALILHDLAGLDGHPTWKGLDGFAICNRDAWNDPSLSFEPVKDPKAYEKWCNLNAFVATLLNTGAINWRELPIWELRDGLEESLDDLSQEGKDTRVVVATLWIRHAGKFIWEQTLSGKPEDLDETDSRILRAGELYQGEPGYSRDRWDFWKTRLGELRRQVSGSRSSAIDEAIGAMTELEGKN
ncbi:hypothetical protein QBC45DRAFT_414846 [Copromyces sp. CBS 386.78]|nr:hypothetical protein QBC45DRAFT_414846 [Copromyces sp. CBS 386.78]